MAVITDPDYLTDGQEIIIDTSIDTGEITISVTASTGTFTRSSGSFVTDGFVAGMCVSFLGFSNIGNNCRKVISSVSASQLVVTDNSGLVDETGDGDEKAIHMQIELVKVDTGLQTISCDGDNGTYTWSGGNFISAGFVEDGYIQVSGFTNSGNNGIKQIQTVTDEVITVVNKTGMVDEAGTGNERITGMLTNDGVTLKCVYSKVKELWISNPTYPKYPEPLQPITDEQFELQYGWDWANDATRYLIRSGGWAVKDPSGSGTSLEEWACIKTVGVLGETDQVYFQQSLGGSRVNFELTGPVNQAIKIYGDSLHGNVNYRSFLRLFCREWGKTYAYADLSTIGETTMTYKVYALPLTNATDPKITHTENEVDTLEPYTNMQIEWYSSAQGRSIGGTTYYFHVVITGANGTAEQIYEFVQRQLRKNTDIDHGAGTKIGEVTLALLRFVGDTLYTIYFPDSPAGGTYIDGFQSADVNRLVFIDDTGTERTFPYTAILTLNFGDNLKGDAAAKYFTYFTSVPDGDYGDADAILVNVAESVGTLTRARDNNVATITTDDNHGLSVGDGVTVSGLGGTGYNGQWVVKTVPDSTTFTYDCVGSNETETSDTGGTVTRNMSGKVNGQSSVQLTFAYDTNNQGGRTSGTDAAITVVAIGLATAQFVLATGTIQRSVANVVSLISALERNYANP